MRLWAQCSKTLSVAHKKESNKNCNSVTHVKWLNYNKYGNRPKVCLHKWMLEELLPC